MLLFAILWWPAQLSSPISCAYFAECTFKCSERSCCNVGIAAEHDHDSNHTPDD
jgi:hypothetical protein